MLYFGNAPPVAWADITHVDYSNPGFSSALYFQHGLVVSTFTLEGIKQFQKTPILVDNLPKSTAMTVQLKKIRLLEKPVPIQLIQNHLTLVSTLDSLPDKLLHYFLSFGLSKYSVFG